MGLEATCTSRFAGKHSTGKARLEQKDLQFRGDFRLDIPLDSIATAQAKQGILSVTFAGGMAEFDLGPQAEKWALKIRYPKPPIDKLGIKPGMSVLIVGEHQGVGDNSFWEDLRERTGRVTTASPSVSRRAAEKPQMIFFFAAVAADLRALVRLEKRIQRDGAIWAVYPKGQKVIREADVMAAAKQAGLVDIKNASFSETHSALKLVIPVAKR